MATIREERENREMRLEDLASKAEISMRTLMRAEAGERVSRLTVKRIARVFGLQMKDLTGVDYVGKKSAVNNVHPQAGA